ncbi:MAG: hypothetical protein ACRCU9_11050 [Iodobacter sp.]
MAPPPAAIKWETTSGKNEKFDAPKPSNKPATGKTETGNISDLPIFCKNANAFLNIKPPYYFMLRRELIAKPSLLRQNF